MLRDGYKSSARILLIIMHNGPVIRSTYAFFVLPASSQGIPWRRCARIRDRTESQRVRIPYESRWLNWSIFLDFDVDFTSLRSIYKEICDGVRASTFVQTSPFFFCSRYVFRCFRFSNSCSQVYSIESINVEFFINLCFSNCFKWVV